MAVKEGKIIAVGDLEVEATVMNGRITYFAAPQGMYHH
jgi:hypothetical protein